MGGRISKRASVYIVEIDNGTGEWFPLTGGHFYTKSSAEAAARWRRRQRPKGSRIVFRVARYVRTGDDK